MEKAVFTPEIGEVSALEWVGGFLVGKNAAGGSVCRFRNVEDAIMGHPMQDDLNPRRALFVFVRKSAIADLQKSQSNGGWYLAEDNTGKDLSDTPPRDLHTKKNSPPENESARKRGIRVYRAKKRYHNDDLDQSYILSTEGDKLFLPAGLSVTNVRSVKFSGGYFLYAVPYNIGRGVENEIPCAMVYCIKLDGDDKRKIGYSIDGFRAIEHELKHSDNNNFFMSLQEHGLKGCTISIIGENPAKMLEYRSKIRTKVGKEKCYLYKRDSDDFNSDVKTYTPLSGFEYVDSNGVRHTVKTDNILHGMYDVYKNGGYNYSHKVLQFKLI